MKFENLEQLKDFLSWAKKERIAQVRVGDVEVTFHGLAYLDETKPTATLAGVEMEVPPTDEEILFHSAGGNTLNDEQ